MFVCEGNLIKLCVVVVFVKFGYLILENKLCIVWLNLWNIVVILEKVMSVGWFLVGLGMFCVL